MTDGTMESEAPLRAEVERLAGGPLTGPRLAAVGRALTALHARFTSERAFGTGPFYLDDPLSLAAYLGYFFPASAAQVGRALADGPPPNGPLVRILDVGSGPGPAAVAAAAWARRQGARVEVTALEASRGALAVLQRLWRGADGPPTTRVWRAGEPLPPGPFDLITASHFLNELASPGDVEGDRQMTLLQALVSTLAPQGRLLLLEPALKTTGRALLGLRDRLIADGLQVLAPCLTQAPCPMLERPRDWCHADRPWTPSPLVERLCEASGLARGSLKYAYVLLSREPAPVESNVASGSTDAPLRFRIVSEPLPEKGKQRYFGCGPSGRHALVRLDKAASERNAPFASLERGDLVQLTGLSASGDGLRVGAETVVDVVQAAVDRDGAGRP